MEDKDVSSRSYETWKRASDYIGSIKAPGITEGGLFIPGLGRTGNMSTRQDIARKYLTPDVVAATGLTPDDVERMGAWDEKQLVEQIKDKINASSSMALASQNVRKEKWEDVGFARKERSSEKELDYRQQDRQQSQQQQFMLQQQDRALNQQKELMLMGGNTLAGQKELLGQQLTGQKELARMQMKNQVMGSMLGQRYI